MLFSAAIRLVSQNTLLKSNQFIRRLSVPALAHFTPYFSDSGSEDPCRNFKNDDVASHGDNGSELTSSGVAEILRHMHGKPLSALGLFNQLKEDGYRHGVVIYMAVIKILCHWGLDRKLSSFLEEVIRMKEERSFEMSELFDAMVDEVRIEGFHSLARAFDALLKVYVTLGMFDEAVDTLFHMKEHGVGPSVFSCNFLMNGLVGHGKFERVADFYEQLKVLGISPNVYTYGIVIKAYSRGGCLNEARGVLLEMCEAKVAPNAFTFAAYLEGLCMHGRSDAGYDVLLAWERHNAPIDAYVYAVLIQGFVSEKKLDMAEAVLHKLEESSILVPTELHYRSLIRGYCDRGDIGKALDIHDAMEAKGIKSNCLILALILQCLCQKGLYKEAIKRFSKFRKVGIFLDGVSYNVAMDALCKLGKLNEALHLFEEMKDKKLMPDVVHYTTLMRGMCVHGQALEAGNRFFREMIEDRLKPDAIAFDVLAGGLARAGLVEVLHSLLDSMKKEGSSPSSATHNVIIEGLCVAGKVGEAEKYFADLEDKGIANYASMVNGYCESSNALKGYQLFLRLFNRGHLISKKSRSKLLNSLCLEGRYDKAFNMFEALLSSVEDGPNKQMCSDLIAGLCRAGDVERARWVLDRMIERGLSPDLITYTIVLNGYCQKSLLKEALDLFGSMKERGISVDIVAYTVLLDGHRKISFKNSRRSSWKLKQLAMAYRGEMKEMGLKPDVVCYTALMDGCCKWGNMEEAVLLFNEMIDGSVQPDSKAYTALISGYCRQGDVDKASSLLHEMLANGFQVDQRTVLALREGEILKAKKHAMIGVRRR